MNSYLRKATILSLLALLILTSCGKKDILRPNPFINYPSPPPPVIPSQPCDISNRPVVNATLVPIGSFSAPRMGMVSATAGNKIVFAGGLYPGSSPTVDIYDFVTNTWSTASIDLDSTITSDSRNGFAIASVGSKIFFAGGGDFFDEYYTSRVDIYDVVTGVWSTAMLSVARIGLVGATVGDKVFFAGGAYLDYRWVYSKAVDIYDNSTNTWSTAILSEGRTEISATSAGNKIYFAGGRTGSHFSATIDIYDETTGAWSTSTLQEAKIGMASIATNDKIFWAGGFNGILNNGLINFSNQVEIRDLNTGVSSFSCLNPSRTDLKAVKKGDNIIFFTGSLNHDPFSGTRFEIYNTVTDQWSTGVLNKRINDATIISANNTIYIAGGRDREEGPYFDQLWKLEF